MKESLLIILFLCSFQLVAQDEYINSLDIYMLEEDMKANEVKEMEVYGFNSDDFDQFHFLNIQFDKDGRALSKILEMRSSGIRWYKEIEYEDEIRQGVCSYRNDHIRSGVQSVEYFYDNRRLSSIETRSSYGPGGTLYNSQKESFEYDKAGILIRSIINKKISKLVSQSQKKREVTVETTSKKYNSDGKLDSVHVVTPETKNYSVYVWAEDMVTISKFEDGYDNPVMITKAHFRGDGKPTEMETKFLSSDFTRTYSYCFFYNEKDLIVGIEKERPFGPRGFQVKTVNFRVRYKYFD